MPILQFAMSNLKLLSSTEEQTPAFAYAKDRFNKILLLLQMGYAKEGQNTKGIHMRLFSRAFIFDDGWKRNVFVSVDCGMIDQLIKIEVRPNSFK
jgi:hypothetical protein